MVVYFLRESRNKIDLKDIGREEKTSDSKEAFNTIILPSITMINGRKTAREIYKALTFVDFSVCQIRIA